MTSSAPIIERFRARGLSLGTAESCTGGLLAAALTDVPGASEVFRGGIVAYHNDVKQALLRVDPEILATHGAVSRETAEAMASCALKVLEVDVAVAITGVAGPGGGSPEKPVGLVYIAVAGPESTFVTRNVFEGDRDSVRRQSVSRSLELLMEQLS
ncbi:MAG: hypothetical protein RLZZ303_1204 [Candidatus Hydrogenedentota bacterium]